MKAIEVHDLKKSYGKLQAVKGISFYVEEGALFSFLGPNGAGKSTTIDTLCTLNSFDSGEATIAGFDLRTQAGQIKNSIGAVFQDSLLDKTLTVRENLMLSARFYHKTAASRKEAVARVIEWTDLNDFIDRPYGKLSGGQRRRADIARALLNTPKILFLDEPTTGLDPQTRKRVWETVRRLQQEQHMTIFLTTHYMEEAANSDYVVIIDDGLIAAQGTPYELKQRYSSEHLYINPTDEPALERYLEQKKLSWVRAAERIDVRLDNTVDALPILQDVKDWMESFEVFHGTMDDVFLNITGKEIRE